MRLEKVQFLKLSKDILDQGNCLRFQVKGRSMQPAVKDGDIINVEPVQGQEIRLGEVIYYKNAEGGMSAHRVIKKNFKENGSVLIVKGDTNIDTGEEVLLGDILITRGEHLGIKEFKKLAEAKIKIWSV